MHLKIQFVILLTFLQHYSCFSTVLPTANTNLTLNKTFANIRWQTPCKEDATARGIGLSVLLIVVIIVGIVGNVIVIAGILYTPSLRSQVTNHFVISLAVADILIPSTVLPFRVMIELNNGAFCLNDAACKSAITLSTFLDVSSITNILMISIDRYTAITFPLSYAGIMSEKRAIALIVGVWLYSAMWAGLGFFDWRYPHDLTMELSQPFSRCINNNMYYYIVVYSAVFIVPLAVIGFMYLVILNEALKHVRAIGALEIEEKENKRKSARRKRVKHLRSMKSIAGVYGAFLFCWLPNCVITIHSFLHEAWWVNFRINHTTLFYIVYYTFAQILPPLNCTLNPFIYTLLHRNFRTAFKAALLRMVGKRMSRRYTETSFKRSYEMQNTRKGTISPANNNEEKNTNAEGDV